MMPSRREAAPEGVAIIVVDEFGTRLSPEASPSRSSPRTLATESSNTRSPYIFPFTASVPAKSSKKLSRHSRSPRAPTQMELDGLGYHQRPNPHHRPHISTTTASLPRWQHPLPIPRPWPRKSCCNRGNQIWAPGSPTDQAHLLYLAVCATAKGGPEILGARGRTTQRGPKAKIFSLSIVTKYSMHYNFCCLVMSTIQQTKVINIHRKMVALFNRHLYVSVRFVPSQPTRSRRSALWWASTVSQRWTLLHVSPY